MTPYGSASEDVLPEATEKEIENTLCTIDCISACRIDSLYAEITYVFVADIEPLLTSLPVSWIPRP
jgi:brefeldin A-resistance guanine nucleotide exchange factor 1